MLQLAGGTTEQLTKNQPMTRRDRINRLYKQAREQVNKFLDPEPPEPKQPDTEQHDRPAEQANPAQEPERPCRKLKFTPPELTPQRKRKIDAADRRLRGQIGAYAAPY
jgi:hypothetical protein